MAITKITVNIKVAWWLKAYLHGVSLMCEWTGKHPDWVKVDRMIRAGTRIQPG
ncbi:hypothetical protein [Pseudomonas oryzihabitans]|uniref:hypothetical protein n=1 Tax=Pseudomonas oryzihabitans TaxID=47885 RepID=UPI001D24533D|nr:hypothetical protein [Pseudomonas oryzihabitans]HJE69827.1 hypothetical protein [Pseudomonas oryzihabitans]